MSAVILGRFSAEQQESLRIAVARASGTARFCTDVVNARPVVADGSPPSLLLIDGTVPDAESFLTWMRGHPRLIGTVVVALVPAANEHAFIEAHMLGADDVVVNGDLGSITRRVSALAKYDPTVRPQVTMGRALLAHPVEERRRLVGRVLRLAGFDVSFAVSSEELAASSSPPAIVVASDAMPGFGEAIATLRKHAPDLPCVLLSTHAEGTSEDGRTVTIAEYSPPDSLLFSANELLRPKAADMRASARVLHAGLCAFRPAGELHPALGLTYNLSREGMYIRTLDAIDRDTDVWLEMRAPRAERAVHLRGKVMWARRPGSGPGGAVPPGFGVRLVESSCPAMDLAEYQTAYSAMLDQTR